MRNAGQAVVGPSARQGSLGAPVEATHDASIATNREPQTTNHRDIDAWLEAAAGQGVILRPHSLGAALVTLTLEGGPRLHVVQRAAGHADLRVTERYWSWKNDLDDNATDYVRL